jgi:methylated-DNA-[protein]-cysteine S-methyltransferase
VLATLDTRWGPMHIAASAEGIAGAELLGSVDGFVSGLARRGFRTTADSAHGRPGLATADRRVRAALDGVARMLDGEDVDVAGIAIDIRDRPAWDRMVLDGVRTIPRGRTASYGEVARRIGRPGAARAVGGAVSRNPVGLLVPCHRVIAGDGSLGGYGAAAWGGVEAALALKRSLLELEGVRIPPGVADATPRM